MMSLLSKALASAVALGCVAAASMFLLGSLAHVYPALDLINNFLPFVGLFCVVLLVLALALRSRALTYATGALLAVVLAPILLSLPSAARHAPDDTLVFLRVVTFNLWIGNVTHWGHITRFLTERQADAVLLQEVSRRHTPLLKTLARQYPHRADAHGLVILSKLPIVKTGSINRTGRPGALILWARIAVNGRRIELANAHVGWPFDPGQQDLGIAALKSYAQSRTGPLIVGGDFNMTPWTHRLRSFTKATALQRFNTIVPSWPARLRGVPNFPLFPIDNVFASQHFAKIATSTGPWLGSDHRPVMADIALIE